LADAENGCKGLSPDKDGKIGGAALGVEHVVSGSE
jgi:hypothetical protein